MPGIWQRMLRESVRKAHVSWLRPKWSFPTHHNSCSSVFPSPSGSPRISITHQHFITQEFLSTPSWPCLYGFAPHWVKEYSLGHVLKLLLEPSPSGPHPPVEEVGMLENGYDFNSQDAGWGDLVSALCPLSGYQLVSYLAKCWISCFWRWNAPSRWSKQYYY